MTSERFIYVRYGYVVTNSQLLRIMLINTLYQTHT